MGELRNVRMSEELALALGADRVEWGEPDADGFYTPTLYAARPSDDLTAAAVYQPGQPPHRRSPDQDYDPTPCCMYCFKAWDETGGYKPEYRCPESPAALAAEGSGE